MSDQGITCGACGATNAANAVICAACGALLAAYATPPGAEEDDAPDPDRSAPAAAPSVVSAIAPAVRPVPTPDAAHAPAGAGVADSATSGEARLEPAAPRDECRSTPPDVAPPVTLADSGVSIPVGAVDIQASDGLEPETAPTPEPEPLAGPSAAAPPPDRPLIVEDRRQQRWATRQDAESHHQVWRTMTHRVGQTAATGVPRLDRLETWGTRQLVTTGIGLLMGSCVILSIAGRLQGGGCLFFFALVGLVFGIVLLVNAARRLGGTGIDLE